MFKLLHKCEYDAFYSLICSSIYEPFHIYTSITIINSGDILKCIPLCLFGNCVFFSAADDILNADEVRTLIKDIWDLRIAKLRKSTYMMVSQQEVHARVSLMIYFGYVLILL